MPTQKISGDNRTGFFTAVQAAGVNGIRPALLEKRLWLVGVWHRRLIATISRREAAGDKPSGIGTPRIAPQVPAGRAAYTARVGVPCRPDTIDRRGGYPQ